MHHPLEEGWGVLKTEVHYLGNERPMFRFKSYFVLIPFGNLNVVITPMNIELGEECLIPQVFQGFSDIWQRVVIAHHPLVHFSIIHNDALFF